MFALVIAASAGPTSPGESQALHGIREAFFAALEQDRSPGVIALMAIMFVALVVASVRWLRREERREQSEHAELEERRRIVASMAPTRVERRAWVRVPGHLTMTVFHDAAPRPRVDTFETQNVGAGGLAFLTHEPPRMGHRLEFSLDLGEKTGLSLHGVVVRVESPPATDAASLVALRLGGIDSRAREHLMKWIATEEVREIAEARRGRACARCGRPLADSAFEMHSTCAAREPPIPAKKAG